jgi:hypothetical protein
LAPLKVLRGFLRIRLIVYTFPPSQQKNRVLVVSILPTPQRVPRPKRLVPRGCSYGSGVEVVVVMEFGPTASRSTAPPVVGKNTSLLEAAPERGPIAVVRAYVSKAEFT